MSPPTVWCLLAGRAGDDAQVLALARALGWPYAEKRLRFNRLRHGPNLLLGASLASLDRGASDPLSPPWPDLVIAAARHSAPVALWIGKRSVGRARLVHLQYTEMPLARFDLVVTMPQFCLPARSNVLEVAAPLNRPQPGSLDRAARAWAGRLEHLPRPRTALLVGGSNSAFGLDRAAAARLGREASLHARATGGSLLVTTSPRTPAAAVDALSTAIDEAPVYFYRWRPNDPGNPFMAFLALADDFIVTADSSSLIAEACSTGRPVHLFEAPPLPGTRPALRALSERLSRWAEAGRPARRIYRWAIDRGVLKSPRDFGAFHAGLRRQGFLRTLGQDAACERCEPPDDLEQAVARIRDLFA